MPRAPPQRVGGVADAGFHRVEPLLQVQLLGADLELPPVTQTRFDPVQPIAQAHLLQAAGRVLAAREQSRDGTC